MAQKMIKNQASGVKLKLITGDHALTAHVRAAFAASKSPYHSITLSFSLTRCHMTTKDYIALEDQFGLLPFWTTQLTGLRPAIFISPIASQIAVILVHAWKDAPFMAIIFLAGMQGIPEDLYDAARVDGANGWQRFWRLTVPLIMPLTITMGLFRLVWSLGSFDLVYGLTFGGPGVATSVLALQVFREGILFFKFGFASAISVILLILVAIIGVAVLAARNTGFAGVGEQALLGDGLLVGSAATWAPGPRPARSASSRSCR